MKLAHLTLRDRTLESSNDRQSWISTRSIVLRRLAVASLCLHVICHRWIIGRRRRAYCFSRLRCMILSTAACTTRHSVLLFSLRVLSRVWWSSMSLSRSPDWSTPA